jgi:YgiT-type zinc finger domain-containing protein
VADLTLVQYGQWRLLPREQVWTRSTQEKAAEMTAVQGKNDAQRHMTTEQIAPSATTCPRCAAALVMATVRTVIWHGDRPAIVEDIPAFICSGCSEQFYDQDVSDALHDLAAAGFPAQDAQREIPVPIFSLNGRIWRRPPIADESLLD